MTSQGKEAASIIDQFLYIQGKFPDTVTEEDIDALDVLSDFLMLVEFLELLSSFLRTEDPLEIEAIRSKMVQMILNKWQFKNTATVVSSKPETKTLLIPEFTETARDRQAHRFGNWFIGLPKDIRMILWKIGNLSGEKP